MTEGVFLHFRQDDTFWHRHDPRLKFLELAIWSILALTGTWLVLAVTAGIISILHRLARTRFRLLARPFLFWMIMAAAIIITSGMSATGENINLSLAGTKLTLPFSTRGLSDGALRAARLLVMLLAGQLLASTTDPADLSEAIRRLTPFLPAKWSATLASTVGLTLSFLPALLDEAKTVRDAALSRGLGQRRSPFRRAWSLGLPLAEAALRRADLTAEALLSRSFSDEPTRTEMSIGKQHLVTFVVVTAVPTALRLAE